MAVWKQCCEGRVAKNRFTQEDRQFALTQACAKPAILLSFIQYRVKLMNTSSKSQSSQPNPGDDAPAGTPGAAERADGMREEAADLDRKNAKLAQEIQTLSERLGTLQSQLHAYRGRLDALNQQLQLAGDSGSAAGFVDQAADQLKI